MDSIVVGQISFAFHPIIRARDSPGNKLSFHPPPTCSQSPSWLTQSPPHLPRQQQLPAALQVSLWRAHRACTLTTTTLLLATKGPYPHQQARTIVRTLLVPRRRHIRDWPQLVSHSRRSQQAPRSRPWAISIIFRRRTRCHPINSCCLTAGHSLVSPSSHCLFSALLRVTESLPSR